MAKRLRSPSLQTNTINAAVTPPAFAVLPAPPPCPQAAAFPDMVLAVASRSGPVRTRYSCGHMPRHMHTSDVTRGVLGALLQTGKGQGQGLGHEW